MAERDGNRALHLAGIAAGRRGASGASEYQGIRLPDFFVVTVALDNAMGELREA